MQLSAILIAEHRDGMAPVTTSMCIRTCLSTYLHTATQVHRQQQGLSIVDVPDSIQLPFYNDRSQIEWREYWTCSAVLHLGGSPLRGHYRALLRVGDLWCIADDGKSAEVLTLHDGHRRNLYVIVNSSPITEADCKRAACRRCNLSILSCRPCLLLPDPRREYGFLGAASCG